MTESEVLGKRDPHDTRDRRYRQRAFLWSLPRPEHVSQRVSICGRRRVAEYVAVNAGASSAGLGGVSTCGSPWVCPVCAPKIAAVRTDEIQAAIKAHTARGGSVLLVTLTLSHTREDRLSSTWDAVQTGWEAVRNARGWRSDVATHGIAGWMRAVEVTRSRRSGWHPHLHVLLFLQGDSTPESRELLRASIYGRWSSKLADLGFRTLEFHEGKALGVDVRHVPAQDAQYVGDYLAKHGRHADGGASGLASEVGRWDLKAGRQGSLTPWQILDKAHAGSRVHVARWREWEDTSKGRRQITWARGFLASLDLLDPIKDEQAAEREEEPQEVVALLPAEAWRALVADLIANHSVSSRPLMTQMLTAAASGSPEDARAWLVAHGIPFVAPADHAPGPRHRCVTYGNESQLPIFRWLHRRREAAGFRHAANTPGQVPLYPAPARR